MNSINHYPNGTPTDARRQSLEAQHLRELCCAGRDNSRRYTGLARSNCRNGQVIFWGARFNLQRGINVPRQTRLERKEMAAKLKAHALLDRSEHLEST